MIVQDYLPCLFEPEELELEDPMIFVVDPDPATGEIVRSILTGYSLGVQTHFSGREFLDSYDGRQAGCLVSETRFADASGLQIQRRLTERNHRLPMIYVSSSIDVSTAVALMRGGAVHILEKPIRSIELLAAIQEALAMDEKQRRQDAEKRRVRVCIAALTQKERQLVWMMATGASNKLIAEKLTICARAVELRRRSILEKLGFKSSTELIRFALLARDEIDALLDMGEAS